MAMSNASLYLLRKAIRDVVTHPVIKHDGDLPHGPGTNKLGQKSHGSWAKGEAGKQTLAAIIRAADLTLGIQGLPDRDAVLQMDHDQIWNEAVRLTGSDEALHEMLDALPERGEGENLNVEDLTPDFLREFIKAPSGSRLKTQPEEGVSTKKPLKVMYDAQAVHDAVTDEKYNVGRKLKPGSRQAHEAVIGIGDYVTEGFHRINQYLRAGMNWSGVERRWQSGWDEKETSRAIKAIDSLFAEQVPYDGEQALAVWRGGASINIDDLQVGDEFIEPGFSSTSISYGAARSFGSTQSPKGIQKNPVAILIPPGAKFLTVDSFKTSTLHKEGEVLLPRGTRFRVQGIKDGTTYLSVVVPGNEDAGRLKENRPIADNSKVGSKNFVEGDIKAYVKGLNRIDQEFPGFVTVHDAYHYETDWQTRVFTSPDGQVGYSLIDHGDGRVEVAGVFNFSGNRGAGAQALREAVAQGANYIEAYDGFLPFNYFDVLGAIPSDRWPWDNQYRHSRWQEENYGTPGVMVMDIPSPEELAGKSYEERRKMFLDAYEKVGGGQGVPEAILKKGKKRLHKASDANAGFSSAREFADYMLNNPQKYLPDVFS